MRHRHFLKLFSAGAIVLSAVAGPALANPVVLFDLNSGKILQQQDAFKRWYPASLSKLMTAYVTFRALAAGEVQLDSPIKVTKHSAAEPPSKMGFKPGSVMRLDNALKMMLVKSANDIAMAVGENVGGSQAAFADRMNAEAARLGMTGTHFVNPNGLYSPDQYTTARDLAVLVMAIRREFPQYAPWFSIEGLAVGKKAIPNYNLLIGRYPGADGMKTGFVCPSGFNMIGSATRNGRTLVAVVLGEKSAVSRAEAAAKLRNCSTRGLTRRLPAQRPLPRWRLTATPSRPTTCMTRSARRRRRKSSPRRRRLPPQKTCRSRPIRKSSTMCRRWLPSASAAPPARRRRPCSTKAARNMPTCRSQAGGPTGRYRPAATRL